MKHNRITRQDYCREIGITAKEFNEKLAAIGVLQESESEHWRGNSSAFTVTRKKTYSPKGWVVDHGFYNGKMILWSRGRVGGTWTTRNWQWLRDYLDSVFKAA
jgi:hypothetical protein